jgi:outer membrane murein-binding lipoprotein Lpp
MRIMWARTLGGATVTAALGAILLACRSSGDDVARRVQELRAEQQRRQMELAILDQRIQAARMEQQRQECRALAASLMSEIAVRRAQCIGERAEFAKCLAENKAHTSNSGMLGCGLGLGAALLTGGAAAPWAAGGCLGGLAAGSATTETCGQSPVCTPDENVLARDILASRAMSYWPQCP